MWELDYKESWARKNWCFWTVVLEKTLESPLDCKEIQPVHPKGNQSWIFIGRTNDEAETLILWPPDGKNWFIGKDPDAGKDWRWEEKGRTEDEMAGWDHSGSWWWTGRPGMLQSTGSQRVGQDWETEMNWNELNWTDRPRSLAWNQHHSPVLHSSHIQDLQLVHRIAPPTAAQQLLWLGPTVSPGASPVYQGTAVSAVVTTNEGWIQPK